MTVQDDHQPAPDQGVEKAAAASRWTLALLAFLGVCIACGGGWLHHWAAGSPIPVVAAGWMLPFAVLLSAIAVMPFIAHRWWDRHYASVAVGLGAIVAAYYLIALGQFDSLGRSVGARVIAGSVAEYISFIFLIGSLFIVSGGISIHVRARATPTANTLLMLTGAVLANVFGTTGASMLLIRPFLRMNADRVRPYHVIFFIFIVSNAGGSLTPIGDPPLFLGYLHGVPFGWVFKNCWPYWLLVNGGLLVTFFIIDRLRFIPDAFTDASSLENAGPPVSVSGTANLLLIGLIIGGILLHDVIAGPIERLVHVALPVREFAMIAAAVGSLMITAPRIHAQNRFNYAPLREVAFLFVGIFLTMVPALNYLHHQSSGPDTERRIAFDTPSQLYIACGSLSAVLDNAPTYLTFLQTSLAQIDSATIDGAAALNEGSTRIDLMLNDRQLNLKLVAISMGAVLFGAMTYFGNGPNFMVKAIAQGEGVEMPSFFGYLFKFSMPVLLPLLLIAGWLFLR